MLDVPYVHTTFTLPHQLNNLARHNKKQIYALLLRSCAKTVKVFLQHVVPAYFHRVRHTGLHAGATYKKIKDQLPDTVKRNRKTVRTVIQILTSLL